MSVNENEQFEFDYCEGCETVLVNKGNHTCGGRKPELDEDTDEWALDDTVILLVPMTQSTGYHEPDENGHPLCGRDGKSGQKEVERGEAIEELDREICWDCLYLRATTGAVNAANSPPVTVQGGVPSDD